MHALADTGQGVLQQAPAQLSKKRSRRAAAARGPAGKAQEEVTALVEHEAVHEVRICLTPEVGLLLFVGPVGLVVKEIQPLHHCIHGQGLKRTGKEGIQLLIAGGGPLLGGNAFQDKAQGNAPIPKHQFIPFQGIDRQQLVKAVQLLYGTIRLVGLGLGFHREGELGKTVILRACRKR
ncbi:hypothetical protein ADICEAN_04264 [Cesiribacter andamanensis AMV16]|uniref:Uncharacterized protein n=1 Tax=Cesiribacter andamanensis AMV16 TaxID=1279009 RepID=M7N071_9BACT|nr:hypothetical protein ADICEAN_04264 [Cesiribacter andamanensis AMV16]